jgi:hypothetical protein
MPPTEADHATAHDKKIIRALAQLDKLGERGEADQQIAPFRDRLAELRPQRPLTLPRLLCEPLDPLLVPGHRWRRGSPGVPRTALAMLGRIIRAGLADTAAEFDAGLAGHTTDDTDVIDLVGARLWPRAAEILATARMPKDWFARTNLRPDDHAALIPAVAAVLSQAATVRRLVAQKADDTEPDAADLQRMLAAVLPTGPVAIAMMVALLIASLPRSQLLIRLASELAARQSSPAGREMADNAIDFALDRLEDMPVPATGIADATRHVLRAAVLLIDLDERGGHVTLLQARIQRVRRKVDIACRARLAVELAKLTQTGAADLALRDEAARMLRRLATIARHIGGADAYDLLLRDAAVALLPVQAEDASAHFHRIKLMEILLGADAARALLDEQAA